MEFDKIRYCVINADMVYYAPIDTKKENVKMKKLLTVVFAMSLWSAFAAGFGIYEGSARGNAVGGALVGEADDATAVYYNPANIAFSTNVQVAVGATLIHPFCDVEVDHVPQNRMDPGWFTVPTVYFTVPLPADFTFGWGNFTEYGLGSHYNPGWSLAADTQQTTIRQVTLNPNIAYKFTDWLSASLGIRESWIQFENYKQPNSGETFWYSNSALPGGGMYMQSYPDAYHLRTHLKGEDWATGWNGAINIKATERLSLGLVYRSRIKHKIRGDFTMDGRVNTPAGTLSAPAVAASQGYSATSHASAWLTLPQSVTFGANYKVTDRYRVGSSITWTEWSSVKTIQFRIPQGPGGGYPLKLSWRNTLRVGFGMEYDLLDWLTVRGGYTFDEDPTSRKHSTTMLPCGDRHIIGSGLGFKLADNLYLDLGYSFIRMNNEHYMVSYSRADGSVGQKRYSTRNGHSHLLSATLRYSF